MKQVEKLSRAFAQNLLSEVGEEVLNEIVKLNEQEQDERICHSHDFTDPNQIMIESYEQVIGEIQYNEDLSPLVQPYHILMQQAWTEAKNNKFYIK